MPELANERHERFCLEYIIDHNATQSAIRAGYSVASAKSQGCRLLTYADVTERIRELSDDLAASLGITAAGVLLDLRKVASYAIKTGDVQGSCRALELLGRHLGLFDDRVTVSVPDKICVQYDYGDAQG